MYSIFKKFLNRKEVATDLLVLVPCFNLPTYTRQMVHQLRSYDLTNINLIDNASKYPPMLDFLAHPGPGVKVLRRSENMGPRESLLNPKQFSKLPEIFCLTDPDLVFNPDMPKDFISTLWQLTEKYQIGKAGLALDISDRSEMRNDDYLIDGKKWKIWEWEARFWQDCLEETASGDPIYRADIDTTFAVYNKKYFRKDAFYRSLRVAGRYTARHLPWYKDNALPEEEEAFYTRVARHSYYVGRPSSVAEISGEAG